MGSSSRIRVSSPGTSRDRFMDSLAWSKAVPSLSIGSGRLLADCGLADNCKAQDTAWSDSSEEMVHDEARYRSDSVSYRITCSITLILWFRLLINGEWKVIKIDFHVPSSSASYEIFTPMVRKQAWAALIQKAFAKLGGSYAKLHGGFADIAFLQLTGNWRLAP